MHERAFVLVPLRDVAPNLVLGGKPLPMLLAGLDTAGIAPIGPL
jgi:2-amino-4-hydroxy-6-hydroxymethyldihydropteridine diphosphokinase